MKTRSSTHASTVDALEQCKAYLKQGPALDPPTFLLWWATHKDTIAKVKVNDLLSLSPPEKGGGRKRLPVGAASLGHPTPKQYDAHAPRRSAYPGGSITSRLFGEKNLTLLHLAIKYTVPDAVTLAIALEWPLHLMLWNSGTSKATSENVILKVMELCPAAVNAAAHNDDGPMTMLVAALSNEHLPAAVTLAIIEMCPDSVQELYKSPAELRHSRYVTKLHHGDTPLHTALEQTDESGVKCRTADAVLLALVKLWPESVKVVGEDISDTPMHYAMRYSASETVVRAMIGACPEALKATSNDSYGRSLVRMVLPLHIALENKHVPEAVKLMVIAAYPEAAKMPVVSDEVDREDAENGAALQLAFEHNATEAVVRALAAAAPETVQRLDDGMQTILHIALQNEPSHRSVQLAIELWPQSINMKTRTMKLDMHPRAQRDRALLGHLVAGTRYESQTEDHGGHTPLHVLAWWTGRMPMGFPETDADRRKKNEICFTLVRAGASLSELNADGNTAEEIASRSMGTGLHCDAAVEGNRHLSATIHEIKMFKRLSHLGRMHFRDWTTVSHAWCTPSAKWTALTVLLVGETYKRGLLPRLPMDCWYRILNKLPRHQLRQGEYTVEGEEDALAQYKAVLAAAARKGEL